MGRRQGDTDLQTLQRHMRQHGILQARCRWMRDQLVGHKYARVMASIWAMKPMTLLAFKVMANECLRGLGIPLRTYPGK